MASPCAATTFRAEVVRTVGVGADGVRLDAALPRPLTLVRPSQFFMVRRGDGCGPLLARPFSLYWRDRDGGRDVVSFLLKVHGPGTRALAALRPGDALELVGPLGNGFPDPRSKERLVCVAGGVGIATFPLVFARAIEAGVSPSNLVLCFGAARKSQLYEVERYERFGIEVRLATDDGSAGIRGTALDVLRDESARPGPPVRVFACGPGPMLDAVARFCLDNRIEGFLSLETRMGCGTGVCNACAVPVKGSSNAGWPVAKACREGPVFAASDLVLEEAHEF